MAFWKNLGKQLQGIGQGQGLLPFLPSKERKIKDVGKSMSFGATTEGALSGAATGYTIGGPWGAAAGGVLGGLSGFMNHKQQKKALKGMPKKEKKYYEKAFKQQEASLKNQYKLAKKYGSPEKFAGSKKFKLGTVNKGQAGLLDYLSKYGKNVPGSLDITKNPSYKQALGNLYPRGLDITKNRAYQEALGNLYPEGIDITENPAYQQGLANLYPEGIDIRQLPEYQQALGNLYPEGVDITQNPLYQQGQSYLSDLMSNTPEAYNRFKDPYMREFQQQVLPEIANRFSSQGGQRSSSFQNALGFAGENFGSKLGALRSGLQLQGVQQGLGYAQQPVANRQAQIENLQRGAGIGMAGAQNAVANRYNQNALMQQGAKYGIEAAQIPVTNRYNQNQLTQQGARYGLEAAQMPITNQYNQNSLLQQGARYGLEAAQQPVANRQQQIANALSGAGLNLGTKAFENVYQPAQYHAIGGLTASALPQFGAGQAQQQPGFFGNIGGGIAQGLGGGIGQGLGNFAGQSIQNRLSGLFGDSPTGTIAPRAAGRNNAFLQQYAPPPPGAYKQLQAAPGSSLGRLSTMHVA